MLQSTFGQFTVDEVEWFTTNRISAWSDLTKRINIIFVRQKIVTHDKRVQYSFDELVLALPLLGTIAVFG
jgi:NAD(P)H-nitrite reductase large subunit